jgi:hypothetical protein
MRREPEFFGDEELALLYMARRLREALRLEELLTRSGIDYCVETGEYTGGLLIRRELTGAFFYVAPSDLERTRVLLAENRFNPYDASRGR